VSDPHPVSQSRPRLSGATDDPAVGPRLAARSRSLSIHPGSEQERGSPRPRSSGCNRDLSPAPQRRLKALLPVRSVLARALLLVGRLPGCRCPGKPPALRAGPVDPSYCRSVRGRRRWSNGRNRLTAPSSAPPIGGPVRSRCCSGTGSGRTAATCPATAINETQLAKGPISTIFWIGPPAGDPTARRMIAPATPP
jgi:hypothetical protein